jgi:AraC-like DNA-binding protein
VSPQPTHFSPVSELARLAVHAALSDIAEIHSVEALSDHAGLSRRAFHNRCQAAGVMGRDYLHFVQCLKAILAADDRNWDPGALIPVSDPRTLRKILVQGGISAVQRPTIAAFLECQKFCASSWFKESVLRALDQAVESKLTAIA